MKQYGIRTWRDAYLSGLGATPAIVPVMLPLAPAPVPTTPTGLPPIPVSPVTTTMTPHTQFLLALGIPAGMYLFGGMLKSLALPALAVGAYWYVSKNGLPSVSIG